MKGMTTCKVCERDFALMAEEHYIARDLQREGGLGIVVAGREEAKNFDAFDCPHCGCQNIMQERKMFWTGNFHIDDIEDCEEDHEKEENE